MPVLGVPIHIGNAGIIIVYIFVYMCMYTGPLVIEITHMYRVYFIIIVKFISISAWENVNHDHLFISI